MRCATEKCVYLCLSAHHAATLYLPLSVGFHLQFDTFDLINDEVGFVTQWKSRWPGGKSAEQQILGTADWMGHGE
jgi:hypothetical protein